MKYEVRRYLIHRTTGELVECSHLDNIHNGWMYYRGVIGCAAYDGVALYVGGTKLASWGKVL